jgi:hypothetical protein
MANKKMNLIQAIKSGKPFRRKSWEHGCWIIVKGSPLCYGGGELYWQGENTRAVLSHVNELTANDWETYESEA